MATAVWRQGIVVLGVVALGLGTSQSRAQPVHLTLPTDNEALFEGDGAAFYQYTDRTFNGKRSRPWQGGQYGFVRNAKETDHGIIFTRFHEGIDIKAVHRDAAGEPLDTVRAIDEGLVVYVNATANRSSYGKYVVVEHWWGGSPFYSLYAHLSKTYVDAGQRVARGEPLARLGYTGRGINRRRAHVHLEINMLLNQSFQPWYEAHHRPNDPNHHGLFNGMNMAGLDVASLYLALREEPDLSIRAFLARQEPYFHVTVPNQGAPNLLFRYPWLSSTMDPWGLLAEDVADVAAWVFTFSPSGFPLRIEATDQVVEEPEGVVLEEALVDYRYLTKGLLSGTRWDYALSKSGLRYVDLLTRTAEIRSQQADH